MNKERLFSLALLQSKSVNDRITTNTYTKADIKKLLITNKFIAQITIDELVKAEDKYRQASRLYNKSAVKGVKIKPLKKYINDLSKTVDNLEELAANIGRIIATYLEMWQNSGATYDELFDLVNASLHNRKEFLKNVDEETTFNDAFFINKIDYDYKGDFIDNENPAPFSHVMRYYFLAELHKARAKNPEVRKQAREALFECIPEMEGTAMHTVRDVNGNKYIVDDKANLLFQIEKGQPLSDEVRESVIAAIDTVINKGDYSDKKTVDFVEAFFANAAGEFDKQEIIDYVAAGGDIGELLDIIVPSIMSECDVIEIANACK